MKYGIGQRVKVKDFRDMAQKYPIDKHGNVVMGNWYFDREMKVYCGEEYLIVNRFEDGTYQLNLKDDGYWYFTDEMLEEVKLEKPVILGVDIAPNNDVTAEVKAKRTYTRRK